jgi:hypothetical protein
MNDISVIDQLGVEWLSVVIRIPEVLGSNLGLETGYPD